MKELPDKQTIDELLKLAREAYEKARIMYDTATNIAERLELRHQPQQNEVQNEVKG